jgi:hypothetical protein
VKSNIVVTVLVVMATTGGCSDPVTPDADVTDAEPDADLVPDADDADIDVDADDADVPIPDGTPPACEAPTTAAVELSQAPARASAPRLASAGDDLITAAVWLDGEASPHDVNATIITTDGIPLPALTLDAARPWAADPEVVWTGSDFLAVWREAQSQESCSSMDTCETSLRAARFATDGTVIGIPTTIWDGDWVTARPALVVAGDEIWVLAVRRGDVVQEVVLGQLDLTGQELGDLAPLDEGRTARQDAPAATVVDDQVIVVASVMPGGLTATVVDPTTAEVTAGPEMVADEISASSPQIASNGSVAGLVYIATVSGSQGSRLMFEELHPDLSVPFPAAEIVGDGLFPKQPQAAAAGPGWVVAWFDGRLDTASDCVTFGFCRDTIYLVPVSNAGPSGEPINLSEDPNDCEEPAVSVAAGTVTAAWSTFREGRRTTFARRLACE